MKICTPENTTVGATALSYAVTSAKGTPELQGLWDGPVWGQVAALNVNTFHKESSSSHPNTQAKLIYDDTHVYVHFRVEDQHVQSLYTNYQDNVCRDSCVEFFFQPRPDKSYFNFEINCGGAMLLYYMENPGRQPNGTFKKYIPLPWELGKQVRIYHSMPRATPTIIHTPMTWQIEAAIPLSIMTPYVGEISTEVGTKWQANLYKCGGDRKHDNYASWSPMTGGLNFHQPQFFGDLIVSE